ncbi:hypothetical protein KL920_001635 [Ogataea angusta]|nr:hypothetical protein KL920_001635 [Ogataea angusta]
MDEVEKEVERFRFTKTKPVYEKRRDLFVHIPSFWYIVLAEHEDFQEYVQTDDMKYLEFIKEIYVEYLLDDDPMKFSITFGFEAPEGKIETQTVTKRFEKIHDVETGEEKLVSEAVDIIWPAELASVNPHLIRARGEMTPADKKKYHTARTSHC